MTGATLCQQLKRPILYIVCTAKYLFCRTCTSFSFILFHFEQPFCACGIGKCFSCSQIKANKETLGGLSPSSFKSRGAIAPLVPPPMVVTQTMLLLTSLLTDLQSLRKILSLCHVYSNIYVSAVRV